MFKPPACADFFSIRTPTLPFDQLEPLLTLGDPSMGEILGAGQATYLSIRESFVQSLKKIMHLTEVREAIFLASPSLDHSINLWIDGRLSVERSIRLERSLLKYVSRIATRSTPFGVFAGSTVGTSLWSHGGIRGRSRSSRVSRL
jgi:hypothetical protein